MSSTNSSSASVISDIVDTPHVDTSAGEYNVTFNFYAYIKVDLTKERNDLPGGAWNMLQDLLTHMEVAYGAFENACHHEHPFRIADRASAITCGRLAAILGFELTEDVWYDKCFPCSDHFLQDKCLLHAILDLMEEQEKEGENAIIPDECNTNWLFDEDNQLMLKSENLIAYLESALESYISFNRRFTWATCFFRSGWRYKHDLDKLLFPYQASAFRMITGIDKLFNQWKEEVGQASFKSPDDIEGFSFMSVRDVLSVVKPHLDLFNKYRFQMAELVLAHKKHTTDFLKPIVETWDDIAAQTKEDEAASAKASAEYRAQKLAKELAEKEAKEAAEQATLDAATKDADEAVEKTAEQAAGEDATMSTTAQPTGASSNSDSSDDEMDEGDDNNEEDEK